MSDDPHRDAELIRLGPTPERARLTTVLVHGRDQDDAVTRDVVDRLALPDVAFVLPVAPRRSWYAGRYFDARGTLEPELGSARAVIEWAIRTAQAPIERIVLAGFSQGACLVADHVAQGPPRRLGGLAVLTGCLIGEPSSRAHPPVVPGLPVLVTCARDDAWIPLADARDTAERFRAAGATVRFAELDDAEHHVSDQAVAALRELLAPA